KPILNQITSRHLSYILVIVIRYFGGILLGKGGLIRAYTNAAADGLDNATVIKMAYKEVYRIRFGYNDMNSVMKIIGTHKLEVISQKYEQLAQIEFSIVRNMASSVLNQFKMIGNLKVEYLGTKQDG
ncbi:MAG: hypothetical protein AMS27_08680, partial [Bacteroides sp. SM23_62_1]